MAIKYYLHKNALAKNPESHKAIIAPKEVHDLQSIINQMLKRGTTLSEADMMASLHLFFEVVVQELQDGNHVNLPIVNIRPGIAGEFITASDQFDASRHRLKTTSSAGALLKKIIKNTAVEKVTLPPTIPVLTAFFDSVSQTFNDKISPNGIGTIVGNHLKFKDNIPAEGVFFVNTNNETFQVSIIAILHPRKLVFSIPDAMPKGNYTLMVKKSFGRTATTIKKATLAYSLTVV